MLNGKGIAIGKKYKRYQGDIDEILYYDSRDLLYPFVGKISRYKPCGEAQGTKECFGFAAFGQGLLEEYVEVNTSIKEQQEFNVVTKPKHYQLIPEKNIEVKHIVAVLADRLGTNGYNGAFIGDYVQLLQYLMRFDEKNGKEDLEKAKEFLSGMIENYPCAQQLKGQK